MSLTVLFFSFVDSKLPYRQSMPFKADHIVIGRVLNHTPNISEEDVYFGHLNYKQGGQHLMALETKNIEKSC